LDQWHLNNLSGVSEAEATLALRAIAAALLDPHSPVASDVVAQIITSSLSASSSASLSSAASLSYDDANKAADFSAALVAAGLSAHHIASNQNAHVFVPSVAAPWALFSPPAHATEHQPYQQQSQQYSQHQQHQSQQQTQSQQHQTTNVSISLFPAREAFFGHANANAANALGAAKTVRAICAARAATIAKQCMLMLNVERFFNDS
jgi:hypothetical protein